MHIERVMYHKTFNLGNYSSEKIGVEFMLNQGEDAKFALEEARKLVHEYHQQSSAGLDHSHIEEHSLPPEPAVLPEIQLQKRMPEPTMEGELQAITDPVVFKSFGKIVELKYPELKKFYDQKLKKLEKEQKSTKK